MNHYHGEPVIGIANSWSELNNCNLPLRDLADSVKTGVREAGGIPLEFNTISLGEELMKPSAMLYRNLMSIEVEEMLRSNPIDGVVLLCNCDKTIPGQLMGAASANLPTIQINAGPKIAGEWRGEKLGSGTDLWKLWDQVRRGEITKQDWQEVEQCLSCSLGSCNVMGTASTMCAMSEVLGMMPPGTSSIGVYDKRRQESAVAAGKRIVEMVRADLRPSQIMTAAAFDNAICCLMALGGSTNAIIHLIAIAGRLFIDLDLPRFAEFSRIVPCITNTQPSGQFLMQDFDEAGGVPAVLKRIEAYLDTTQITLTGQNWQEILSEVALRENPVILSLDKPLYSGSPIAIVFGNLAPNGAVVKASSASPQLLRHTGPAIVFDSYDEMLNRIDDPLLEVDEKSVLVLRNVGPKGVPGMPEWGMIPIPSKLQQRGVRDLVRISDSRMSGTSFGTVVLHVSPEAACGGPLAIVQDGDLITLNVQAGYVQVHLDQHEIDRRRVQWAPPNCKQLRGYPKLYYDQVLQADEGCDFEFLRPRTKAASQFVLPVVGRS